MKIGLASYEFINNDIEFNISQIETSHGSIAGRTVTKTWEVNPKAIGKFIDIRDAYQRVYTFVMNDRFLLLSRECQMDAAAFLITMESGEKQSITGNHIIEEVIQKKLIDLTDRSEHPHDKAN